MGGIGDRVSNALAMLLVLQASIGYGNHLPSVTLTPALSSVLRDESLTDECSYNEFSCGDGECVSLERTCDGNKDCIDGSDEQFCQGNSVPLSSDILDRSKRLISFCNYDEFSCKEGGCVTLGSICDGFNDCIDGSDEQSCHNEINRRRSFSSYVLDKSRNQTSFCRSDEWRCRDGSCIGSDGKCNGIVDCPDGSDETQTLCRNNQSIPNQGGKCVLPPYPEQGTYTVGGKPYARPGKSFDSAFLNITCNPGFGVENDRDSLLCYEGFWSDTMPKCIRFCRLYNHASIEYHCIISGNVRGTRICGPLEPEGTRVEPVCRINYYNPDILSYMKCIDGNWNYIAICKPECGTITPEGIQLIINGTTARRGELPWHAGIYTKKYIPYMQICGGSLISTRTIISAAHCFWSDVNKLLPATDYAVAVGKIFRPWNNPNDVDAQKSDVTDIKISPYFQGTATNFQDDIALVIVATPFTYQVFIRPICLDFYVNFDRQQLYENNLGKVAGWGLVAKNGNASQVLKVVELPFVKIEDCIRMSPQNFRELITSDKICAGYTNGTSLCQGDSGGGLAFPTVERSTTRYYLRGVVSGAPKNEDLCNANSLTIFTQILKHEHFIKEFLYNS